ncbi:hypothetical protein AUR64_09460 [Haloprofundus marisrubri]|uniref:Uncharacterized protein n=1 Tax=Haloprofundus marisrubri TaxID=1514971 RepID=A0A0W1R905_9EURY|nr:hypothetical protein [Haloprofundus marisrubri]KTG09846.1 hypothetical protein AUR64_09460 [Haloprofundus marisrubri]
MVSVFVSETVLCTPGGPGTETLVSVLLLGFGLVWTRANREEPWLGNHDAALAVTAVAALGSFVVSLFGLLLVGVFDDLLGYGGFGCGVQWQYLPGIVVSFVAVFLLLRTGQRIRRTR